MAAARVDVIGPQVWVDHVADLLRSADLDVPVERHLPDLDRSAKCGTRSGYNAHLRRGEPACGECRAAENRYQRDHVKSREPNVTRRDDWMDQAACRDMPPAVFYDAEHVLQALATCSRCPVRSTCADYAIDSPDRWAETGIWGGLTPRQRQRTRDQRRLNRGRTNPPRKAAP